MTDPSLLRMPRSDALMLCSMSFKDDYFKWSDQQDTRFWNRDRCQLVHGVSTRSILQKYDPKDSAFLCVQHGCYQINVPNFDETESFFLFVFSTIGLAIIFSIFYYFFYVIDRATDFSNKDNAFDIVWFIHIKDKSSQCP